MKLLNSVVIKLWLTIILIVTTVLILLSAALISFFSSFMISETGKTLYQNATKIEEVLMSHHDRSDTLDYAKELIENPAGLIIVKSKNELNETSDNELKQVMIDEIRSNKDYNAVFTKDKHVTKTITVNYLGKNQHYILLGFPSQAMPGGAIILYQDINSVNDAVQYISLIVLIVALILILLTTIFAFFLSTRITKPLLTLKQSAFQVAKGEPSAKIESFSRDEIGELAVAFKKMEHDIKDNMDYIRTERNLRDKLIHAMADGVLSYELNLDVQLSNPVAENFMSVISSEDKAELNSAFEDVIARDAGDVLEITASGRHFVVIISPVQYAAKENKSGAVALIRDMTEEWKNDELKKRFIADVSHELRTPIQMLQGYTEALLDGIGETHEERQEMLGIILDESKRLSRMVTELLNVAKYDAGQMALDKTVLDGKVFLSKIAANFKAAAREHGVQLELHAAPVTFAADSDKLIQVMTNLVDNALRYTHAGDTISLELTDGGDDVNIVVRDTGVGIAPQHLSHIFDRFYKVDEARTRGKNGTGLGLFIVKSIITQHGGTITARSVIDSGTTFTITIPKY